MTCRQLGGPCDTAFSADTLDEIVALGSAHVLEKSSENDAEHLKAKEMMDQAQNDPKLAEEWYKGVQSVFAGL